MAQPMPPPPPPKKGMSLLPLILVLIIAIGGLAWYKGWFTFEKDADGKNKVVLHGDKFKADKEAAMKSVGDAYTAIKSKITGKESASKTAKPEDKSTIDKEIDALKKQLADLEEAKKKAETATDEAGLKGLDETVKKLLNDK